MSRRGQVACEGCTLFAVRHARELAGPGRDEALRGGGLVGPDPVDQVVRLGQLDALWVQNGAEAIDFIRRVQPRIEPYDVPFEQVFFQVVRRFVARNVQVVEQRAIDLVPDLQFVPPIGKDRGTVEQDDSQAGRAGEAGQPGQAFIAGGDVFALMRIGARNQEGIETVIGHLAPEMGDARRGLVGPCGDGEILQARGRGRNSAVVRWFVRVGICVCRAGIVLLGHAADPLDIGGHEYGISSEGPEAL